VDLKLNLGKQLRSQNSTCRGGRVKHFSSTLETDQDRIKAAHWKPTPWCVMSPIDQ